MRSEDLVAQVVNDALRERDQHIAQLEAENLQLREQYADAVQADKTASALQLKNQATMIRRLEAELTDSKTLRGLDTDHIMRLESELKRELAAHERTKAELEHAMKDVQSFSEMQRRAGEGLQRVARERGAAQAEAAATLQACVGIVDAMAAEYADYQGEEFNAFTVLSAACWRLTQRGPQAGRDLAARVTLWQELEKLQREQPVDNGHPSCPCRRCIVLRELATLDARGTKL